ncbi:hypothetical protein ACIQF5_35690 [Streptomyces goshikiensis]|uniref:hypothetical protein n=1 Tax=Streptomyces goshikiensis TaxID=1942 RepID=UPI00381B1618
MTRFLEVDPEKQLRLLQTERTFLHNAVEDLVPDPEGLAEEDLSPAFTCGFALLNLAVDRSGRALFKPVAAAIGDPEALVAILRREVRAGSALEVVEALVFVLLSVAESLPVPRRGRRAGAAYPAYPSSCR